MMVVGLGAAAYCSMGNSLRWKESRARAKKGDDPYSTNKQTKVGVKIVKPEQIHLLYFTSIVVYDGGRSGRCCLLLHGEISQMEGIARKSEKGDDRYLLVRKLRPKRTE